jgi:hypothetical protein
MERANIRNFMIIILLGLTPLLGAENRRLIPLDMFLIIDGSESFQNSQNDALVWLNNQILNPVLMEGDSITVWTAGESAQIVFSGDITNRKEELNGVLSSLNAEGRTADFSGALTEAAARASRVSRDRLAYTILIMASAESLERALTGSSRELFRWFRSERYERWQVLVVGTDIAPRVREAAASYMRSVR